MGRSLQHVAFVSDVDKALREGQKVKVLCGVERYPMTKMKDSIPTCTKCARIERQQWVDYANGRTQVTTWSATFTGGPFMGEATV